MPRYEGSRRRPPAGLGALTRALGRPDARATLEGCRRLLALDRPGRDPREVGQDILALAAELADAELGGLWIRTRRRPTLELLAARAPAPGPALAPALPAGAVGRLGAFPLAAPPRPLGRVRALLQAPHWASALLVRIEAEPWSGILAVGRRARRGSPSRERAAALEGFARLAAIPLGAALQRDALGHRDRQLRAVERVGAALARGETLEEWFRTVSRALEGVVSFDLVALVTPDRRGAAGVVLVGQPGKPTRRVDWSAEWAETLGVLRRRRPLLVADLARTPARRDAPLAREFPAARALLGVAFPVDGGAPGALLLVSRTPGRFDDRDARTVEPIAGMLAAAVRHARGPAPRAERHDGRPEPAPAGKELGQLVAAVAHRIRNPLTVIGTTLQYLRGRQLPGEEQGSLLETADAKVREIDDALEGLLSLSRPLDLRREPTAVEPLLREIAEFIRARADTRAVEVRVEVESGTRDALIDRRYLGQALLTLALEVLDAMSGGRLVLGARPAQDAARVLLRVVDRGGGARRRRARAPDAVRRGEPPRDAELALAITRRLVAAHGGSLEAQQDPAGGAAFTLSLPVAS